MAQPQIKLEYLKASNVTWTEALTHDSKSAVVFCHIGKQLNNPSICELTLANPSKNTSETDVAKSVGNLTSTFTDFMQCRVTDEETGLVLFRGRIYKIKNQYDLMYGNTMKLTLRDALYELLEFPTSAAPPSLKTINLTLYSPKERILFLELSPIQKKDWKQPKSMLQKSPKNTARHS